MKKLIVLVISMVSLTSCVFAPFSKNCKCQPEEREEAWTGKDQPQIGSHDFFLEEEEKEEMMMVFYRVDNQGVCNGEGCEELHP
tara:strand:+ start:134 stop:385 length:252 start_codon:yes stop_codon:yes gene_type:complete